MSRLEQFGTVRIRQLHQRPEEYNGWGINKRPPQVGDTGTLLDILNKPGVPDQYVVESSGVDGITIWLGDFLADELEPLKEPSPAGPGPSSAS